MHNSQFLTDREMNKILDRHIIEWSKKEKKVERVRKAPEQFKYLNKQLTRGYFGYNSEYENYINRL